MNISNSAGSMYLGLNGTTATAFMNGGLAYAAVFATAAATPIQFATNNTVALTITGAGTGLGAITAPTAALHLPAGTATANTAPLQYTPGVIETVPRAGLVEYDGTNFYVTPNTTVGRWAAKINSLQYIVPVTTNTVTATAGVERLVCNPAGTLGALTVIFPASPVNGQTFDISISQVISLFTISGGTNTIDGVFFTSATNSSGGWVYVSSVTTWFKVH